MCCFERKMATMGDERFAICCSFTAQHCNLIKFAITNLSRLCDLDDQITVTLYKTQEESTKTNFQSHIASAKN